MINTLRFIVREWLIKCHFATRLRIWLYTVYISKDVWYFNEMDMFSRLQYGFPLNMKEIGQDLGLASFPNIAISTLLVELG